MRSAGHQDTVRGGSVDYHQRGNTDLGGRAALVLSLSWVYADISATLRFCASYPDIDQIALDFVGVESRVEFQRGAAKRSGDLRQRESIGQTPFGKGRAETL